ncbi:MAG: tRNA (adenosine(37)-N6)-threonylcarbamoyltransferase complex ATPase subunit type 1 TsaE [Betaproteobacteria bacterium HGW-Betaproteobacteria-8]|nr:MAG: tRNA (adenosine(37)-N6)-threonylcarbamoyltransferase complex ATPase subunit type 1 TsaE [Betaproteobacteria bacterium HGW-Betaproteobacteria-8]
MAEDFTLYLADEAATLAAGADLASRLKSGLTIYLHGDLGAGKTTFVRGLLHGLGYAGKVKSPTYTLVEPYVISRLNIYHFDLYRFIDPEEWDAAGFRDYFNPQSICLVEWPEKAGDLIPQADMDVSLLPQDNGRMLRIRANSSLAQECLVQE